MFNTKLEVDRHVENCLKKINSDSERNLRCFAFAKLYYKVQDYEHAHRYISNYLSVKPLSPEGQCLLGKVLEKLGKHEAALDAYRTSFDLDPKQNNLVIKVCELLSSDDVNLDQVGAKYFCEKAQSIDPYNPVVFKLKEQIVALESKDPNDVSKLLIKELETRPLDIDIRIRLLRHLMQNKKVKEAYTHAYDIEQKHMSIFSNSLNWYETVAEVLVSYQRENSLNNTLTWEFWMLFISVLDKSVSLSLDERSVSVKTSTESATAVFNFDQNLKIASENIQSCPEKQLILEFLNHYTGQLCLHLSTLLYKYARKDLIKYKEAAQISLPLLFASNNFQPIELQNIWVEHTTELIRQQLQRWHREAAFRCSQVGHLLLAAAKDKKSSLIERASQNLTGLWREQVYKKLFVTRDQQQKIKSSYFALTPKLVDLSVRLPDPIDLLKYDEVAQLVYPDSLHHYIWIGLNQKLPLLNCSVFQGLQYSMKNLNNCAAETLNVLDIQSFIYSAVLCAQAQIEGNKHAIYYNAEKPKILFAAVTGSLGTTVQSKWLRSAYKMYRSEYDSEFGDVRLTLIRGIECVRCIGNHGLDVKLLVLLAKIFEERATNLKKQSEIEFNDTRAELYWKAAMPLLEKLKKNQAISYASNRIFEYKNKDMNHVEILKHIDEGKLFIGTQLMKKKEYEKALHMFETLKDPYASFNQAHIYKVMADKETNQNKENLTSEMRSQNIILLTKARDYYYLTLDRLRDPNIDRKHPINDKLGTEIEKIERLLSRIDPDICLNRNECDGMSDENVSSIESDNYNINSAYHTSYTNGNFTGFRQDVTHNVFSTPYQARREARPSPERLDAQLRQLAASKDAAIGHILEQNKIMVDSHKCLVEELKTFKDAVCELTSTVNELKQMRHSTDIKEIKKSVDELKASVDELQNFRNITDIVYEMKKEITELKKDTNKIKSNQLSDEDLYVLDEEYGTDYSNINSNVSALTPTIYPNLPRLPPPANSLAYASALYHGMYPMYPYAGLGIPQAGALPFGPESQLNDFRTSLAQGLPPPPLNQGGYQHPVLPTQPSLSQMGQAAAVVSPATLSQTNYNQSSLGHLQQQTITNFFKDNPMTPAMFGGGITTSTHFPISAPITSAAISKPAPVNVVITASDPLPTNKITTPQILSVTIPPQHLKGAPLQKVHNYQISLPSCMPTVTSTPSVLNQKPMPVTTQSLLSNIAPPLYSAIADKCTINKNSSLGLQIEKSLSKSFNNSGNESGFNKSNASASSLDEHDPCPDFKPIIPLPDEVPVNTGEENETVLFCERAKLYRYTNKEWKERGVGDLKLLRNPENMKVRLIMRRDQVHKICANHYLTNDMELIPMNKNEKAYIWAANDYAEGELVIEKLCVQFKTPDLAKKFYEQFNKAKIIDSVKATNVEFTKSQAVVDLGGFKFTSTPTFKPKDDQKTDAVPIVKSNSTSKTSPFAGFTFQKETLKDDKLSETPKSHNAFPTFSFSQSNQTPTKPSSFGTPTNSTVADVVKSSPFTSFGMNPSSDLSKPSPLLFNKSVPENIFAPVQKQSTADNKSNIELNETNTEEFVPTAVFAPVIPLPDLIDVQTGEENSEVLFESKAKLFRFDTNTREWKERGLGQMKVLKESDKIRLLMRREQVHKVCCNHQLLKDMKFAKLKSVTVSWSAMDFSEGVFNTEVLSIRFKTEEIVNKFIETLNNGKDLLDDNNLIKTSDEPTSDKKIKPVEVASKTSSLAEKFKSKAGSWECKNCYVVNEPKVSCCVACESQKSDATSQKAAASSQFCFGVAPKMQSTEFSFGATTTTKSGFGDAFKPKEGTWECKACYSRNEATAEKCISCETPKVPLKSEVASPQVTATKGIDLNTGGLKFSFGVPTTAATSVTNNFGAKIEPATAVAAGFGNAFKPKVGSWECKECYSRNEGDYCLSCECPKDDTIPVKDNKNKGVDLSTGDLKFNFGMPATATNSSTTFSFNTPAATIQEEANKGFSFTFASTPAKSDNKEEVVFGSPHKAGFEFTPRSPRRQSGGHAPENDSENSYYDEEEDNIYFKPVIPLPDKVEVMTGEEEEDVLYSHRAKLFRHLDSEWKERGIGELKILFKPIDKKIRVLMRREQVHKICLNHVLTKEIKYTIKDEKTWLFCAPDFSEGEIEYQNFCLRFKTAEVAQEFKKAVDDALRKISNDLLEDDSDVEFVSETYVTPEEVEQAKYLMLPPKFMAYKQLPDCICDQCKKEEELFKDISNSSGYQINKASHKSIFTSSAFNMKPSDNNQDTLKSLLKPSVLDKVSPEGVKDTPKNIFGSNIIFTKPVTTQSESPFSGTSSTTSMFSGGSLFGNTKSSFGSTATPIFGGISTTTSSIFGKTTFTTNATTSTIFGSVTPSPVLFGNISTTSIFGNTNTDDKSDSPQINTSGIFGQLLKQQTIPYSNNKITDNDATRLFSVKSENLPKFEKLTEENSFAHLGSGAPVFGSSASKPNIKKDLNEDSVEDVDEEHYDPHYEPIIPMPDEIVVKTGEEEEVALFDERSKLYRFSDKEWKERGVGQLKVLFHPKNNTYRLLLRREQVHKIVLNQLIKADLEITANSLTPNSWMWAGLNYREDEMVLEKLAVRFKNENIYNKFHTAVTQAINNVKELASTSIPTVAAVITSANETENLPQTIENINQYQADTTESVSDEEEEYDDDDETEDTYAEEDDRTILFTKECTLSELINNEEWHPISEGLVEIFYDPDIFGCRIFFIDDSGCIVSNTIIGVNTTMDRKPDDNGNICQWYAVERVNDVMDWKTLSLTFSNSKEAEECYNVYLESHGYAEQSEIIDDLPSEISE